MFVDKCKEIDETSLGDKMNHMNIAREGERFDHEPRLRFIPEHWQLAKSTRTALILVEPLNIVSNPTLFSYSGIFLIIRFTLSFNNFTDLSRRGAVQ